MDFNWLTPKAQARPAGEKGWGSFVVEPISKGETVAAFGGWIVSRDLLSTMSHDRQGRSIQVDEDLYLVSSDTPEPGDMLKFRCLCAQPGCRELVTGSDWREPALQAKYASYFSPYLVKRLAAIGVV